MPSIVMVVFGALGAWSALRSPRVVEITRDKVRWGGEEFSSAEIDEAVGYATTRRRRVL